MKTDTSTKGPKGLIFDIQRFSLHDGYGIRTLVFMKGCPLRCLWCSNPESQRPQSEIMFYDDKCIECGGCIEACPYGEMLKEHWPVADELCLGCGKCAEVCYAEARQLIGRWMAVEEVLGIVLKDRVFYEESGGGLTIGGGEPAFQPKFVSNLLKLSKNHGVHTAIETSGHTSWKTLNQLLEYTDLLLFDLKHMDSTEHKEKTGIGNERILENARRSANRVKEMIVRLPLIPVFNDDSANLNNLGNFIRDSLPRVRRVDILPYHSFGESKSARLRRNYALSGTEPHSKEEIQRAKNILQSYGLEVKFGG